MPGDQAAEGQRRESGRPGPLHREGKFGRRHAGLEQRRSGAHQQGRRREQARRRSHQSRPCARDAAAVARRHELAKSAASWPTSSPRTARCSRGAWSWTPKWRRSSATAASISRESATISRSMRKSKRPSILALRGPIVVDGTFKSPRVHPAMGPIAARVGASVALGAALTPHRRVAAADRRRAAHADADCGALIEGGHRTTCESRAAGPKPSAAKSR